MKTKHVSRRFRRFLKADEAVSALEYAILVGVITLGVGGAILAFSNTITAAVGKIGAGLNTTVSSNSVKGGKIE